MQREVSERLRVSVNTVLNWETGKTEPLVEFMPAIIPFLGYDPFPEPTTLSERMLAKRRLMGWSIKEAAQRLGVDDGTWGEWEKTGAIAWSRYRELLEAFLDA
jgi:transcriptional regulator with XRE-family HTH domain